jgi:hypothetical protein
LEAAAAPHLTISENSKASSIVIERNPMTAGEISTYTFALDQVNCTAEEVLRVMGYRDSHECPVHIQEINACLDELASGLSIQGGFLIIDEPMLDAGNGSLRAADQDFILGKLITSRLRNIERLAVFVCTAGPSISILAEKKKESGDLLGSYVIDSAGSVIVEAAVDKMQDLLDKQMCELGFRITNRYSPGYCHWHTSEQKKIFSLLPPGFCGITLTDSFLMIPVKSVSGLIGIGRNVRQMSHHCSICSMKDCYLRKEPYAESAGHSED